MRHAFPPTRVSWPEQLHMKFNHDKNIDIQIFHLRAQGILLLDYPGRTRELWRLTAEATRSFSTNPEIVKTFQKAFPSIVTEWTMAQASFDRLAAKKTGSSCHLALEEAENCFSLFSLLSIHRNQTGNRWKHTLSILFTLSEIVPCQVMSIDLPLVRNAWGNDPSIECYENLCAILKSGPVWFSTSELYFYWRELTKHQGAEPGILALRTHLKKYIESFQLTLQGVLMPIN